VAGPSSMGSLPSAFSGDVGAAVAPPMGGADNGSDMIWVELWVSWAWASGGSSAVKEETRERVCVRRAKRRRSEWVGEVAAMKQAGWGETGRALPLCNRCCLDSWLEGWGRGGGS
jgi:hypothetical protein